MSERSTKPQRGGSRQRGRPLPWSDPTVDDVQGWLFEALDNVADAKCSAPWRFSRAEDASRFMSILYCSWPEEGLGAHIGKEQAELMFWRSERLIETLLNADQLAGSRSDQAYKVKAAEKLSSVLTLIMTSNAVTVHTLPEMITGLRQAAIAAARFSASAGAAALLEVPTGLSAGTDAAADAAQIAWMLFRAAVHHEKYLATLH